MSESTEKQGQMINGMKVRVYEVLARAVEEGILYGWNRAHKYGDEPDEEQVKTRLYEEVMNSICEWFTFDDTE